MIFDTSYFISVIPKIMTGVGTTFFISVLAFLLALIIGAVIAIVYRYRVKGLYQLAVLYVSVFRGTPVIAQMFFIYFGLPHFIPILKQMDAFTAAILTLGLNMSAYVSEVIRASMDSVDKGQVEAGMSVGMTNPQVLRKIIFPQATRIAIPSLANDFIMTLKGSAVAFTIGVTDIMAKTKIEATDSYKYFECYAAVMLIYWIIVLMFTYGQSRLEKKFSKAY